MTKPGRNLKEWLVEGLLVEELEELKDLESLYYNELELFLEISMYLDKRNIEVYRIQRLEFVME